MSKLRPWGCIIASALTIIAGIILLVAGSVFTNRTTYVRDYWTQIYGLSIYSIAVGGLAIIFSSLLIYVVNKQFPALITLFSGLLVFVAFAAIVCGVLCVVGKNSIIEKSYQNTAQIFGNYSESDLVANSKKTVSKIQRSYQCCGVERATYWVDKYTDGTSTPDSCCIKQSTGCGKGTLITQDKIYLRGCAEPISVHTGHKFSVLITFNFVIVVLALATSVLGVIFERYIRQQYQLM